MKKRILALILVLTLLISLPMQVLADAEKDAPPPDYYRIQVRVSKSAEQAPDFTETADFMIPTDKSGVYINAEHLMKLSGYQFQYTEQECAYVDNTTHHVLMFPFGSKEVTVYIGGSYITYNANLPALYEEGVAWVPFTFAMQLLNASITLLEDSIRVSYATPTTLTTLSTILPDKKNFRFDWVDEIGYSEEAVFTMSKSAGVVDFMSGMLAFESSSWVSLLTCLNPMHLVNGNAYDRAFAEEIAMLFTSPQQNEIEEFKATDTFETLSSFTGDTAKAQNYTEILRPHVAKGLSVKEIIDAYDELSIDWPEFTGDKTMVKIMNGVKKYQKTLDKADGFMEKLNDTITVNKNLGYTYINFASYALDLCHYYSVFANRSEVSLDALRYYAKATDLPESTAMDSYVDNMDTPWVGALDQYVSENMAQIVMDAVPLDKVLGVPAMVTLLGWDLISGTVPFFKDGLESTEKFKRSEYAILYQDDCMNLVEDNQAACFREKALEEGYLEDVTDSTYAFLKFSMIARNSAAAAIQSGKLDEATKTRLVNHCNTRNKEISNQMAVLAEKEYGVLPSENSQAKKDAKTLDKALIDLLTKHGEKIDDSQMTLAPVDEITYSSTDISPEEAAELVREALYDYLPFYLHDFFGSVYSFACTGSYRTEDYRVHAVEMLVEGTSTDNTRFFVPFDGTSVWIGGVESDGDYYFYTGLDLDHMLNPLKLIYAIYDLYNMLVTKEVGDTIVFGNINE